VGLKRIQIQRVRRKKDMSQSSSLPQNLDGPLKTAVSREEKKIGKVTEENTDGGSCGGGGEIQTAREGRSRPPTLKSRKTTAVNGEKKSLGVGGRGYVQGCKG